MNNVEIMPDEPQIIAEDNPELDEATEILGSFLNSREGKRATIREINEVIGYNRLMIENCAINSGGAIVFAQSKGEVVLFENSDEAEIMETIGSYHMKAETMKCYIVGLLTKHNNRNNLSEKEEKKETK